MTKKALIDLYPSPEIPEALPPTVERLKEIVQKKPDYQEALFGLGNLLAQEDDLELAQACYEQILKTNSDWAEVRCNLGIIFFAESRFEEALSQFRKAVNSNSKLERAYLYSGKTEHALSDSKAAESSFLKATTWQMTRNEAQYRLGEIYHEQGKRGLATQCFAAVSLSSAWRAHAEKRLAEYQFSEGKELYSQGQFVEACERWSETFRHFESAFAESKEIKNALRQAVDAFNAGSQLSDDIQRFINSHEASQARDLAYPMMLSHLFSIGKIPEFFCKKEDIDSEIDKWNAEIDSEGVFPYQRFRIGLLRAFVGDFATALADLSFALDHLPATKHRPLKLESILRFSKDVVEKREQAEKGYVKPSPEEQWRAKGFSVPFEQQLWQRVGFSPEDAFEWNQHSFTAQQAKVWRESGVSSENAALWNASGFSDAVEARLWLRGGFTPVEASSWRECFVGEDISRAVQAKKAGFQDPKEASEWLSVVLFPWDAMRWKELGFTPSETSLWLKEGVKDPFAAKIEREQDQRAFEQARELERLSSEVASEEGHETELEQKD